MSTTVGALTELIQDAIDDQSTETKAQIHRAMNQSYREIGLMHFWQAFLVKWTIASTILPGDLEKLYALQPSDTDFLYFPMQLTDQHTSPRLFGWFLNLTVTTPILTGTDMVVTANSTSVTSATGGFVSGTHADEYIRIGSDGGIYKIASVTNTNTLVLSNAYRGASDTGQYFEVRPEGTKILGRSDEDGTAITDTSDVLWYLKRPLPLYNDYDSIPLPGTCEALRIMTLQRMLEGDKYDNDALKQQDNFKEAIGEMKAMEPTVGREVRPRDLFGNVMGFGRLRKFVRTDSNGRRRLGI